MADVVTPAEAAAEIGPQVAGTDPKLLSIVAATCAFVGRYHDAPADGAAWGADMKLGAAKLAAGLYRNANAPGIKDNGFGATSDTAFRRVTDLQIEQLLRIGRFYPPQVG